MHPALLGRVHMKSEIWYACAMDSEPFAYPPLQTFDPAASATEQPLSAVRYPSRRPLRVVVDESGYFATHQGSATITAALRGSTATFYSDNGFRFRHPQSDIDIIALTAAAGSVIGARYLFYNVVSLPPTPRDMDVLCFSPARLAREQATARRIFLTTKLIQPGIPICNDPIYQQLKMQALTVLILRGAARRRVHRVTPSGAARLVLEEDLFAEPWRWLSLRTYYVDAPSAPAQRANLTRFAQTALERLAAHGYAVDITAEYAAPAEPVYLLYPPDYGYGPLFIERARSVLGFVYDQFSILFHSGGKSFAPDKAVSFVLKAMSLAKNPFLRFDADLIFG
jgi:hypothetical protein